MRYDYAHFHDGEFTIEKPSAAIEYMQKYEQRDLKENDWFAISTKLSLQYKVKENIKIYTSYGKGFRPPILDKLCRSGKTRGGFQIANPNLNPETIHNYEIGSEVLLKEKLSLSPAIYYSRGKDFLYFVSTGDYVDMGYWAAILHSENVSKVEIYGAEMDVNYTITDNIRIYGNYSYAHSTIIEYQPTFNQEIDLKTKIWLGFLNI